LRVAFLSVSSQMGGSEVMLLQILRELRASDPSWDLHLIVPTAGPLADRAAALGVHVVVLPMPAALSGLGEWGGGAHGRTALMARYARAAAGLPAYERRLRQALAAIDPDVIHSNGFKAHVVAARGRPRDVALVWHMHEYVSARPVTRSLLRRYARRCHHIVAVSESVAADVRRAIDQPASIRVIYNAVDLERFTPTGPTADLDRLSGLPPCPTGTVRVGLIATFSRWKGHESFLKALSLIPASRRIRGYVIGGAVYETAGSQFAMAELHGMAAGLGLADRVGFTGFVHETDHVMRALDVVVHASIEPEAFGLVIAEAMACGRAVLTSGIGGAGEIVRDGEDALTHRPGDAAHLANRIALLAEDDLLRARLARAARETAINRFDGRRLSGQFKSVYESAVRDRVGAAR
jgi:glycosyltransferase involved in cell wall biosynthesis